MRLWRALLRIQARRSDGLSGRRPALLALLLVVTGSVGLLAWLADDPAAARRPQGRLPDYYMEDFTTLRMKQDGSPRNRLTAAYMAHYPEENITELLKLEMELFREDKPPLYIIAEQGRRRGNSDTIVLSGPVKIREYDDAGAAVLEVDTADVRVFLDEEYAETDQRATIVRGGTVVTGIGLRAFLPQDRLEIIEHEKTVFDAAPGN